MHRAADFLGARDLHAFTCTSARMYRSATRRAWLAQIHARFPYKKFDEQSADPRKILLNLEAHIEDDPPHGKAWVHYASASCASDLFLRGDIIIDKDSQMTYIFDGTNKRVIFREPYDHRRDLLGIPDVFRIPFEFHISYYDDFAEDNDNVLLCIDPRVKICFGDDNCEFVHGNDIYMISYEHSRDMIEDYLARGKYFIRAKSSTFNRRFQSVHVLEPF